uniref:Major facilitator superfamily (MFS) profile domain-containing protein n=1 Tax=Plectus sambesii TaxID=2011161 RepID=A0A914WHA8_9BILA
MALSSLNIKPFHVLMFVIWQLGLIFSGQQIFPVFFNYAPKWKCQLDGLNDEDDANLTDNDSGMSNNSCSLTKSERCALYEKCQGNITFEPSPFYSLIQEFDLVCGHRSHFATVASSCQFAGVIFGTFIFGHLGDRFGRRLTSIVGMSIGVFFACASGLSPTWLIFGVMRFIAGTTVGCVLVVVYMFVFEHILPEQRMFLRCFFNWGTARIVISLICMMLPYWRWASIGTALAAAPIIPLMLIFVPESPVWLESQQKQKKQRIAANQIAVISLDVEIAKDKCETKMGTVLERQFSKMSVIEQLKVFKVRDLVAGRKMALKTGVICFMWFTAGMSTYISDLNIGNLGGDFYYNQLIIGTVISLSKTLVFWLDTYVPGFSRRLLHQVSQSLVIVCFVAVMLIMIIVPAAQQCSGGGKTSLDLLIVALNITGVVFIEYTWDACYLCGAECFPTEMRTLGISCCSLMARVGAFLAPTVAHMADVWAPAPFAAVSAIGLVSLTLSVLFLEETKPKTTTDATLVAE